MATALVAINAKAEGDLVISGTKGYVYVPAPWWKTEYYEYDMKISIRCKVFLQI